ncbi:TIGR04086 family membrane protein [Tissierella sp. MSJ-40]|uniref:TIGR04086 family membrane protein n=1 Tax=Tissierella simiarum TaxID=2841534 RepID=A0ABS6EA73_9FIRM|nr:TIGR04086 family membrane protein [Tissierella simiarum]MBU5439654.1 TIGR04086 family membrane protein [Tissierella simiarum]
MKVKGLDRSAYLAKALLLSYIMTCILILVFSMLLTFTSLKESRIPLLNTIVMIISITSGSVYAAMKVKEKGWINGGIIGVIYYLILMFLSFLFIKPFILDIYSISKFVIALVTGVIGGVIGINLK